MDEELKENLTARQTWLRGVFIVLFAFLLAVARVVMWAVVVLQFLFTLFAAKSNDNLLALGASLARYIYQCFLFVSFNTEQKPFPFADWPSAEEAPTTPPAATKQPAAKKARSRKTPKKTRNPADKEGEPPASPETAAQQVTDQGVEPGKAPDEGSDKPAN